jgi:hypothetical protein
MTPWAGNCGNGGRITRRDSLGIDDPAHAPRVVLVSLDLADVLGSAASRSVPVGTAEPGGEHAGSPQLAGFLAFEQNHLAARRLSSMAYRDRLDMYRIYLAATFLAVTVIAFGSLIALERIIGG